MEKKKKKPNHQILGFWLWNETISQKLPIWQKEIHHFAPEKEQLRKNYKTNKV